jgi:Tfp pilus assembly protein PilZ
VRTVLKTDREAEKRAFLRHPVEYTVRIWSEMLDIETKAEVIGEVLDISSGGLFVRSDFLEIPGTPVSLLVWLPSAEDPVPLKGHVAWVTEHPPKGPGMGIKLATAWDHS